mgnify:FL=1
MFQLKNKEYTLEQLQKAAEVSNMGVDAYIERAKKESGLIDKRKDEPGKTTPPKEDNQGVPAEGNVAPEIQPTVTELPLVDTSLALPEQPKTGTLAQTEFIPKPISKEREEEILLEYDKVSNIDS